MDKRVIRKIKKYAIICATAVVLISSAFATGTFYPNQWVVKKVSAKVENGMIKQWKSYGLFAPSIEYSNDVEFINSAVSSSNKNFQIRKSKDPRAHSIHYLNKNKTNKKTFLIDQIVKENKNCLPFIIKIDIEGAELDLFRKNIKWLNDFNIILIELHDWMLPNKSISSSFIKSLSLTLKKNKRDLIIQGENLISIKINK